MIENVNGNEYTIVYNGQIYNTTELRKTLEEKKACYFSRSRQELWTKGLTSGNIQEVEALYYDCDADSLLVLVKQTGVACHTGNYSCFFYPIMEK